MKLDSRGFERLARTADPKLRAILVHGPDEGLVRERVTYWPGAFLRRIK